jgi:thiamine biosynthesis lipoprotein
MVEIGGELHCKGLNSRGQKWRIGIERPIEGSSFIDRREQCIIQLTDCAVSTSGGYRQCWHVADGRRVQHTINPATGLPVTHNMQSVTVVGKSTAVTDALCTTLMVAGPDKALELVGKFQDAEAYIIFFDEEGTMREDMTEGFRDLIIERNKN